MARINIDDNLYRDTRFFDLVVLAGSKAMALGYLVEAWTVAQAECRPDNPRALIPIDRWHEQRCSDHILSANLAVIEDGMIYMRGAEVQFKWLFQRMTAGKAGGLAKASGAKRSVAVAKPLTNTLPLPNTLTQYKEERECTSAKASPAPLPRLVELWNEHRGKLAEVKKSNASRNKRVAQRWPENTEAEWVEIIARMARSDFMTGKNDRGWKGTFDWLLQPESHLRVMEGKYDNATAKTSADVSDADWEAIFGEKRA